MKMKPWFVDFIIDVFERNAEEAVIGLSKVCIPVSDFKELSNPIKKLQKMKYFQNHFVTGASDGQRCAILAFSNEMMKKMNRAVSNCCKSAWTDGHHYVKVMKYRFKHITAPANTLTNENGEIVIIVESYVFLSKKHSSLSLDTLQCYSIDDRIKCLLSDLYSRLLSQSSSVMQENESQFQSIIQSCDDCATGTEKSQHSFQLANNFILKSVHNRTQPLIPLKLTIKDEGYNFKPSQIEDYAIESSEEQFLNDENQWSEYSSSDESFSEEIRVIPSPLRTLRSSVKEGEESIHQTIDNSVKNEIAQELNRMNALPRRVSQPVVVLNKISEDSLKDADAVSKYVNEVITGGCSPSKDSLSNHHSSLLFTDPSNCTTNCSSKSMGEVNSAQCSSSPKLIYDSGLSSVKRKQPPVKIEISRAKKVYQVDAEEEDVDVVSPSLIEPIFFDRSDISDAKKSVSKNLNSAFLLTMNKRQNGAFDESITSIKNSNDFSSSTIPCYQPVDQSNKDNESSNSLSLSSQSEILRSFEEKVFSISDKIKIEQTNSHTSPDSSLYLDEQNYLELWNDLKLVLDVHKTI